DPIEQRERGRHLGARQAIGGGVARGRQEPAEFQSAPISLHGSIVPRGAFLCNWCWSPRPRRGTIPPPWLGETTLCSPANRRRSHRGTAWSPPHTRSPPPLGRA